MASQNDNLPNDNKDAQDSAYNPSEQAQREGIDPRTSNSSAQDSAGKQAGGDNNDDSVRDGEEKGGWNNRVSSPYAGTKSKSGQGISKANFKSIMKKRGPVAAIITLVLGGGIGAGVFFGPSLLLVQIQESFLKAFDSQNTSLTIRTNKILANKLVEQNTSGSCDIVKIVCRFSRPSNKLLGNLEKSGVLAFDKDGNQISKKGIFQSSRPSKYTFNGKEISAKDFAKELRTNAAFRSAFHRAYNPRFVGFTDAVFKKIQTRFGFDTSNKDAEAGTKKTPERLNDASKGVNAVAGDATEEASQGIIKNLLSTRAGQLVSKIAKGGKGDTFGLVAASVCAVSDVPGIIIGTVRAYQLVQVVNYSMQFLIAGSALKAGTITTEQATALGLLLTTAVANKTAMDSFGMKYAMYGDTKSSSSSYTKFIPGGSASSSVFGKVASFLTSDIKKNTCDFATNPATGAAINVGLAAAAPGTLGTSLLVAGINIGAGFVVSAIVEKVGVPLIQQAISGIDVKPLLGFFLGDLTQKLTGEDVGNALASGASNMMSQTANAGGNMPLSVNDAVAYHQSTQDVNIAYAQEDRATHSPFDPTNPNTMVGSIVGKLIPYLASINSIGTAFTSLASIPSGSLATLLNTSTAGALTAQQYSLCNDPAVTGNGIAAGPFCNVEYGIPTKWLDMNPQAIIEALVASGDVDGTTGEIAGDGTSGLSLWAATCTDGDVDQLKNCQIVDKKTAEYSLYIIDHRIQQSMDETTADSTTAASESTTKPATSRAVIKNDTTTATNSLTYTSLPLSAFIPTPTQEFVTQTPTVSSPVDTPTSKPRIGQAWYWGIA